MNTYHFTIVIRDARADMPGLEDSLFNAGCDDALVCSHNQTVYLEFDREADSAATAIRSALDNIRTCMPRTSAETGISPPRCTVWRRGRRCIHGRRWPNGCTSTVRWRSSNMRWLGQLEHKTCSPFTPTRNPHTLPSY